MIEISQDYYTECIKNAFCDNDQHKELYSALCSSEIELSHSYLCIKHNKLKQAQKIAENAELIIQTVWGINSKMGIDTVNMFSVMFKRKTLVVTQIEQTLEYHTRMQLRGILRSVE